MSFMSIGIELTIGFVFLFAVTKILGKTQINQISAFDFISALILGELVGNALYDEDSGITEIIFTVSLWGTLIFLTEYVTQKSRILRHIIEGTPSIIIRKGNINYKELKKNHLDMNQLQHLLRNKGVFSIRECEYVILESDGSVSILRKPLFDPVRKKDLNLQPEAAYLPLSLILDGEILYDNLKIIDKDEEWLFLQMKEKGCSDPKEVLFAEYIEGEPLLIQSYSVKS
ncbi:DUF421 domain-containing protein [Bacillus spongiae]|uniref:DUF421 domain-containing protein n=1 Tax=Bacillus spongiae TaxID=2683610 RepID=A0ABU8HBE0_9BACI